MSNNIRYMQYPAFPQSDRKKLDKLDGPDGAWTDLHLNLVSSAKQLRQKLSQGEFDLILLLDTEAELFRYQKMGKFSRLRNRAGILKKLGSEPFSSIRSDLQYLEGLPFSIAELAKLAPVIVVDLNDWICLTTNSQRLLTHCAYYYKRELPFNRYYMYYQHRPAPWKERRSDLLPDIRKVYNIPLGIEDEKYFRLKKRRREDKDIDVLYAGAATSTLRIKGLDVLQEVIKTKKMNGVVITDSLPYHEYCNLVARSKVTISIEGGGWDCFRHYEAVALGSLPFMNKPLVDAVWWRNQPEDLFFENDFSNFEKNLLDLIAQEKKRANFLSNLTEVVEQHMLHSKIVEYMVLNALENGELCT